MAIKKSKKTKTEKKSANAGNKKIKNNKILKHSKPKQIKEKNKNSNPKRQHEPEQINIHYVDNKGNFKTKSISKHQIIAIMNIKKAFEGDPDGVDVDIRRYKDKNDSHLHIITDNIDENYISVGLTTKKTKGKGSHNYRLKHSPFNDGKESYVRRQGQVKPKHRYENHYKGVLNIDDYKVVKSYGEKAKNNFNKKNKDDKKNK